MKSGHKGSRFQVVAQNFTKNAQITHKPDPCDWYWRGQIMA